MRILVIADLHFDAWQRAGRDPLPSLRRALASANALILAGDLANNPQLRWPEVLSRISNFIAPERVYAFPGNHDYYYFRIDGDDVLRRLVEDAGMHWAQKRVLEIGGVRFICATLWTDFLLLGNRISAHNAAWFAMRDYRLIGRDADGDILLPDHIAAIHTQHLVWLSEAMKHPFAGKTVIVTHHCPSPSVSGPTDRLTPAFASNLDGWILEHRPDLWLFGHTHRHLNGQVGQTRIANVSFGYPEEVPAEQEVDIILRGLIDTESRDLLIPRPYGTKQT